jgi:hypothetical protein
MTASVVSQAIPCPAGCGAKVPWNEGRCPACGADAGAPNVRLVSHASEQTALQRRHDQASADAITCGANQRVQEFTTAVQNHSHVTVNVNADFAHNLFSKSRKLYANYHRTVGNGVRKPASFDHDRQRCGVDGTLWGSIACELAFGALSLDGCGPVSYGPVSMTISDKRCQRTASFLERNSFHFVEEHHLTPGKPIPLGYRSAWENRHLLAGAKLAKTIKANTLPETFASILLCHGNDRQADEFIEAFIYGPFDAQAIAAVVIQGLAKLNPLEQQLLKNTRDFAEKRGINWNVR